MKVPTRMKAPTAEFLKVVQALNELAKKQGIAIHVTVPGSTSAKPGHEKHIADRIRAIQKQQRKDLAWLESELRTNEDTCARLMGNYVAVHNTQIVAVSESKDMALLGATQVLKRVEKKDILVVPVCVSDTESEDEWQAIKAKLGMI